MRKTLVWLAVAVIFLAGVIALAPARLVPQLVSAPGIRFANAEGTLWHGRGNISLENQHIGALSWDVRFLMLFKARLTADYVLKGNDIAVAGVIDAGFDSRSLTIEGTLDSGLVNPFVLDYDLRLSGQLELNDVQITTSTANLIENLQGTVYWQGGPVRYKLSNIVTEVDLNPVMGSFSNEGTSTYLSLETVGTTTPILRLHLEVPTGWLHIQAFPDFLEFANVPSSYLIEDSKFLFEVSHQIYR